MKKNIIKLFLLFTLISGCIFIMADGKTEAQTHAMQPVIASPVKVPALNLAMQIPTIQKNASLFYGNMMTRAASNVGLTYVEGQPLTEGTYIINSVSSWLALQKYSQEQDLSGCQFEYLVNGESSIYTLTTTDGFTGIGSEQYPFKGTLYTNYDAGNIVIQTEKSLFRYLSSAATVGKINIQVLGSDCCAGLAQNFVVDSEKLSIDLSGIAITGEANAYISNSDTNESCDYAGGFFAEVVNEQSTPATISFSNVSLSVPVKVPVNGKGAGGWIGRISGPLILSFAKSYEISNEVTPFNDNDSYVMGGLIGVVDRGSEVTLTQSASSVSLMRSGNVGTDNNRSHTVGNIFGTIDQSGVDVNCNIQVVGGNLYGKNAGGFAGEINASTITLNNTFTREQSVIYPARMTGEEEMWSAIGMFAGKVTESAIQPGESLSGDAVTLYGDVPTGSYSIMGNAANKNDTLKYHVGGFAGYVKNSDLAFSAEHGCNIVNFSTEATAGNVSSGIGYYQVNHGREETQQITYIHVKVQNAKHIRLICWRGNCGGLVGKVVVKNSSKAALSDCTLNAGTIDICSNAGTNGTWSLGVGYLDNPDSTESKLSIYDMDLRISNSEKGFAIVNNSFTAESYGNVIGIADSDFEIRGAKVEHSEKDLQTNNLWNYGGLVGEIRNQRFADTVRKVSIADVSIGRNAFYNIRDNYGGLFGSVGKKTAVSIGGRIELNGGTANVSVQKAAFCYKYMGSVAGSIDNSLLYIEPDAQWHPSDYIISNEIGNYGSVIRNQTIGDTKLIEQYQVTGTLDETIDSVEDFMRLAIVLNTQGMFMPSGNADDSFDGIRAKAFTLTQSSYDLTQSGLLCIGRNDKEGLKYPFTGSFTGIEAGTEILYKLTGYGKGQTNLGLFPSVGDGASFQKLRLNYEIAYQQMKYNTNTWHEHNPVEEHAGGLACYASGNITLKKISYGGTLSDCHNATDKISNKVFNKKYDYLGGLIGQYSGGTGKTLDMANVNADMTDFSCVDSSHVFGGMVAYVNTEGATGKNSLHINMTGTNSITGKIVFNESTTMTELTNYPVMVSSFISVIGKADQTGEKFTYTGKCNLSVNDLAIKNVTQNITSKNSASAMGGLLGYQWEDVNAELSDITIGDTDKAVNFSGDVNFGGLLHAAYGRIDAARVKWKNTSIDAKNKANLEYCSLFVRDGQYLYLSVEDYEVENDVTLTNYTGQCFDELVGYNLGGSDESHGGIVSIQSSSGTFLRRQESEVYQSYQATVGTTDKKNSKTRYYYDLNELTYPASSSEGAYSNLDSPEDVMIWHLLHYINPNIRETLSDNIPTTLPKSYTISGNINMSGYSIYPTTVKSETFTSNNQAKIIFDAQKILNGESAKSLSMYPNDVDYQHYQMQAGLFMDVAGISVDGLTVSGTYSNYDSAGTIYAGALVAGKIFGIENGTDSNNKTLYKTDVKNRFTNITLSDLWCVSTGSINYDNPIGLMIADISSGADVTLDGISMKDYQDGDVTESKKAAGALIGNVGGAKSTYITVSFNNMDIADAAQDMASESLHSSDSDEALAKASFIYSYDYEENCTGIYIFNYDDYKEGRIAENPTKKITLGRELGDNGETPNYAVEEYFDREMPVGKLSSGDGVEISYQSNNYLPYVYLKGNERYLLVNPKVGNITKGCGTYEDPYQISTTRQMITLYRYMYEKEDFEAILQAGNWKMNQMGTDNTFCDKKDSSHVCKTYTENGFPAQEDLSQAYYQITEDIDFSSYPEFTGFGTEKNPFIGVFIGKENSPGQYPVITMSKQSSAELANYGFIQNAKGCVVKNLQIQFEQPVKINAKVTKINESTQLEETIDEGGAGAGVIATVNGGENIIDNVTVSGTFTEGSGTGNEYCFVPQNTKAMIGGYVGIVNKGGVILRNISTENLAKFKVSFANQSEGAASTDYLYTGSIIGRVKDGYVIYDGDAAGNTKAVLTELSDFGGESLLEGTIQPLPISRSYDIINNAYIAKETGTDKIIRNTDGYSIQNDAQLQVISMALNSGALTYNGSSKEVGYSSFSRQRHGNYDYVGNCTESDEKRKKVITADNFVVNSALPNVYGSFLFQYFDFGSDSIWSSGAYSDGTGVAALNPEGNAFSYTLTGGVTYDMSVFKTAFRGLGARYFEGDNVFRSNFAASSDTPATIKVEMIADGIQDVTDAALLNNVTVNSSVITISNIILTGTIENKAEMEQTPISQTPGKRNAAGFVSTSKAVKGITFQDVFLDGLTVRSQNYAGGFVAYDNNNAAITITSCGIKKTGSNDTMISGMSDVGGLVGYTNSPVNCTVNMLEHVKVTSGNVDATENNKTIGGNAGGLIAKVENNTLNVNKDSETTMAGDTIIVQSAGMPSKIGGIVGWCKVAYMNQLTLKNLTVENVYDGDNKSISSESDNNSTGIAGIIGYISSGGSATINSVTVGSKNPDDSIKISMDLPSPKTHCGGIAGFVGRTGPGNVTLNLTDCHVDGYKKDENTYTTVISGGLNVAGIIGNTRSMTGKNLSVEGTRLTTTRYVGGISGYHEDSKTCNLTDVRIKDSYIDISEKGYNNDGGFAGGICGSSVGDLMVKNATVDGLMIAPQFNNCAGGIVGRIGASYNHNGTFELSGSNSISNSKICGGNVGGVIGYIYKDHNYKTNRHNNVLIRNNILLTHQKSIWISDYGIGSAGGCIGENAGKFTDLDMEGITIEDNLIAGYANNSNGNVLYLGGLEGRARNETDVYGLRLKDNYIGMLKLSDTESNAFNYMNSLQTDDISTLKNDLYYSQYTNGSAYQFDQMKYGNTLDKDSRYQYSYLQGTILGYCEEASFNRMINVSVYYTDSMYRPISDVGMVSDYGLTSNQDMYGKSRELAAVVYDGEVQNSPTDVSLPSWASSGDVIDEPYVFGNLEHIMTDTNKCYYWLDKNYQKNGWIDDSTDTLSINNIYQNTYMNGETYRSKLKVNDQIVPVVVYDSADCGSLDEIVQTYINILTNNSGALNSRVAYNASSLTVTTSKMRIRGGTITKEQGTASVLCETDDSMIYRFESSPQGDELDTETGEGTFTLIHIDYNNKEGVKKWSFDIPVYVEKRLKIHSNMRMLPEIQYDTEKVKKEGKYTTDANSRMIFLPMGTGYSIYCEYIYVDILEGMTNIQIPKTFIIDGSNEGAGTVSETSFIKGSQITLIPLGANNQPGIPYYYTVERDSQKEINFEDFKDASGNKYTLADISQLPKKDTYQDVCSGQYSNVATEQFMLYIDPPEINKDQYSLYKLKVKPKQLFSEGKYTNLKTRTDFIEHCYERVNELPAVKYDIVSDKTFVDSESKLSSDGTLKVNLQYNVSATTAYWATTRSEDSYLDIAFYLKKAGPGSTSSTRVALPAGTVISYGDMDTAVLAANQSSVYYYQGKNSEKQDKTYIQINQLTHDITNDIAITFDFSNADMSEFEADTESRYSIVAELLVTSNKDLPGAGEVRDSWEETVTVSAKDDIGFALEVDDLMTLGMNRYSPETTDSGVIPYTASIAFPERESSRNLTSKYYTLVYQLEEKTSRKDAGTGKPTYVPYTGDAVSLYLGKLNHAEAKMAMESATDSVNSGKGYMAVSYQFTAEDIARGIFKIDCTLVANCANLNMTNFRVKAFLIVSDELPDISPDGNSSGNSGITALNDIGSCLKGVLLRNGNWSTISGDAMRNDLKNDFFVFTVAKIKTRMQ